MGEHLQIGVCGIGSIGFRHARLLSNRPNIDLYLCDPVSKHIEAGLSLKSIRDTTHSFEAMLEWPLHGIILATPEALHVEQGVAVCKKGIPVLVEKPVAESLTQGSVFREVVRDTGTAVVVGYVLRYAECMNLTKRFLEDGRLGTLVSFQIMLGGYETLMFAKTRFSPADRNKLIIDYSHEWDYLQWFLGPVRRVVATSHQSGQLELTQNPNIMDALLVLESGVSGTVHLDYVQLPSRRRFVLIGDQGTLDVDVRRSLLTLSQRGEDFTRNYQQLENLDVIMDKQHDHFLAVIRNGIAPRVTIEDGLKALCVADALIRSTQSGLWEPVATVQI